ncbi:protein-export chaperone SecB [Streptococcus lutetiensis]|nr:protein-export chaperone SecB [Streptococcus lutetiensis]
MMDTKENKSSFQFTRPILKEAIFLSNETHLSEGELTFKFEVNAEEPQNSEENNKQYAKVFLTVSNFDFLPENQENIEEPYFLRVTMGATFTWFKDSPYDVDNLLKINAPSLLLSYIRPVITDLTGLSEYNEEFIPFIDFSANNKKDTL